MKKIFIFVFSLWIINPAYAINVTKNIQIGQWQVVEIAGSEEIMYTVLSKSINEPDTSISFNFVPSKDCFSIAATMMMNFKFYQDDLDSGMVFLAYKLPNQNETIELVKTKMLEGNPYVSFFFEKLTVKTLLQSKDKGKLAIWVHPSGDGTVKRSKNMYFSLEGFSLAYKEAERLCNDNR